jgi:hypothetical protein
MKAPERITTNQKTTKTLDPAKAISGGRMIQQKQGKLETRRIRPASEPQEKRKTKPL